MISVIVPIYNVEKYLRECVDSIINQTYRDLEIILVDDGSPDGCGRICDEYAQKDHRIRVVHKKNGGLSDARNAGIEIAMGEYYVFVDSDDVIHPQMIEILYQTLLSEKSDMAICKFSEIEESENVTFTHIEKACEIDCFAKDDIMRQLWDRNLITVVAWNKIYRAQLFQHIRYPVGRVHEDEFVIHRILQQCKRIVYINEPLYYYRKRSSSIMGTIKEENIRNGLEAYEDRILFLTEQKYFRAATDAKLQMMHMIVKYRKKIKKSSKSDEIKKYMQMRFSELYVQEDVQKALTEELKAGYAVFYKSPYKYYFVKSIQENKEFVKDTIKKWIHYDKRRNVS